MAFDTLRSISLTLITALQRFTLNRPHSGHSLDLKLLGTVFYLVPITILLYVLYLLIIYPNFFSPLRHLPCPKGAHPIFGHAAAQFSYPRGERYLNFAKNVPNDGLIRLKGIFNTDQILVTDPRGLAEVLVSRVHDFPKPVRSRDYLRRTVGDGLIVAEGIHHKQQRKHISPSFTFRQIKRQYPLFWEKALKMTKVIEAEIFGSINGIANPDTKQVGVTDIDFWAPKATLDIIGVAGLGRDFNTLENSGDKLAGLYEQLTTPSNDMQRQAMVHIFLGHKAASLLCPAATRCLNGLNKELRALSEQLVADKKEQVKAAPDGSVDTLTGLIQAGLFSDEELVDQLLTLLIAGHETTSSAFTWTLYLLSCHPHIQESLREEVRAVFLTEFSTELHPNFDIGATLESLPLLNGVCNETLRLFPTVPITKRTTISNTTLLGSHVPAGTLIILAPWAVNKDPALWGPKACEFDPGRWKDPETGKPNQSGGASTNYAFLTFLHGPRSCIGQGFARAELRALVAAFVGAFEFTLADPDEEVIPAGVVTTKPKDGLKLKLTKTGGWCPQQSSHGAAHNPV